MTLLNRFDTLVALDRNAVAADARLLDLSFLLEHADPADLARLTRQVLELAAAARQPRRPKHMHEWLT